MAKRNQKIPVGDLRPGMYVVKLDRPWISTPFDRQGFPIRSAVQVDLLAKFCKSVQIDSERTVQHNESHKAASRSSRATAGKKATAPRSKPQGRKPEQPRAPRGAATGRAVTRG